MPNLCKYQAGLAPVEKSFRYGKQALARLTVADPVLAKAVMRIGPIRRRVYPDPFAAMLRAILGQQISSKAQDAIWTRFLKEFSPLDAQQIAATEPEIIKSCGTSMRKAKYIAGISAAFASGRLNSEEMAKMDDESLSSLLMELPGVGKWTTEMLLIFCFQRPNVLSFGDLAIRRGMMRLYGHAEITKEIFTMHRERYSPDSTLAGIYLWEIASRETVRAD